MYPIVLPGPDYHSSSRSLVFDAAAEAPVRGRAIFVFRPQGESNLSTLWDGRENFDRGGERREIPGRLIAGVDVGGIRSGGGRRWWAVEDGLVLGGDLYFFFDDRDGHESRCLHHQVPHTRWSPVGISGYPQPSRSWDEKR